MTLDEVLKRPNLTVPLPWKSKLGVQNHFNVAEEAVFSEWGILNWGIELLD
jgi:hypothetical protein